MQRGLLRQMQITDVRVRKITKEGKMKAIVSITIDDEFVVHDIKVIEGEKGLFIAMPSKKPQTASTVTLHIPSIPEQGISSRRLFWRVTKKHLPNRQRTDFREDKWGKTAA